jgi:hypothetical protein
VQETDAVSELHIIQLQNLGHVADVCLHQNLWSHQGLLVDGQLLISALLLPRRLFVIGLSVAQDVLAAEHHYKTNEQFYLQLNKKK